MLHFLGQRTQLTQHFGQLRVEIRVHLAIRRGALLQLQANLAERVADEQWLVGPCQGVPAFQHRRGIAGLGQAPPHVAQPPVVELETCTERLAYQPQQGSQFLEALARLMHPSARSSASTVSAWIALSMRCRAALRTSLAALRVGRMR